MPLGIAGLTPGFPGTNPNQFGLPVSPDVIGVVNDLLNNIKPEGTTKASMSDMDALISRIAAAFMPQMGAALGPIGQPQLGQPQLSVQNILSAIGL